MELTDEQYLQVIRYGNGEMSLSEKEAFENAVKRNEALAAETNLFAALQSLYGSASGKLSDMPFASNDKNRSDREVWQMIVKARQDWEAKNGNAFSAKPAETTRRSGKVIALQKRIMWAAAVVFGIILLIGTWWLQQRKPAVSEVAANGPKKKPGVTAADTQSQTPAKVNEDKTNKEIENVQPPKEEVHPSAPPLKEEAQPPVNTEALFASAFEADKVPALPDSTLDEPFASYEEKNYADAIEKLEMHKAAFETRSLEQPDAVTVFNVHYYLGLSYLAAKDSTLKAPAELEEALKVAKGGLLQSKARWYLALAYLRTGDSEKATALLRWLAADSQAGNYRQKAEKLLNKLLGAVNK